MKNGEGKEQQGQQEQKEIKGSLETASKDEGLVGDEIARIATKTSEKAHRVIDVWEYDFPADIDPERVKNAREVVNSHYPALQKLEEKINGSIKNFLAEAGVGENEMAENDLWKGIYNVVPEFTQRKLRKNENFDLSMMPQETSQTIARSLNFYWRKYSKNPVNIGFIKEMAETLSQTVAEIAKNEFEMLKTVDQVREVLWDMHAKLQKKSIEERLIKAASREAGIPLVEGQKLQGVELRLKPGFKDNEPFLDDTRKKGWTVKEVYVNKSTVPDPEDKKNKQDEMLMTGVWVAIEESGSGRVHRMSTTRLKDFVNLHKITPKVSTPKDLTDNITHLSEMKLDVKPGDVLEYDKIEIDPSTRKTVLRQKKVVVLSIDAAGVKLNEKVLLRSAYDVQYLDYDELKDELTLGEFARWMNQNRPVPQMDLDSLLDKLKDHYDYMNDQYKRSKNCHLPISLSPGEILHADAPGNPLFEVESVNAGQGTIKLKPNRVLTFPQFLRWVYENDIEPYDPELEATKMEVHFKAGKKSRDRAKKDAEDTIKHFKDTDIWRDTLKKLREKGIQFSEPSVDLSGDITTGVEKHSYSRLSQWLKDTQWLRLDDIFVLFKTGYEYYSRNWQRRQKFRYSSVGKNVPWFGTEFERISQQAETEEMQQFKDAMDQWGIPQIEQVMYDTNNRDQLKACFNALAPKGMLRWDDKRLYAAINRFTDINHQIPIPTGDPYTKFDDSDNRKFQGQSIKGKNVVDFLPAAIDSLWGEGSYVGWKRQNDDSIDSCISQTYKKAAELEADPKNSGGIAQELSNLLTKHMNGEWIDQTEYEGLIRFCLEYGKAGGKDKVYYLLMGVNAKNSDGRTIMGWERVGGIVTKYSNQFPALDYLSSSNRDPKRVFGDANGTMFRRAFVRSDFDYITNRWVQEGLQNGVFRAGAEAEEFLRKQMLTSENVQNRLEKGIRNAQNFDHDDSPYFIPGLKDSEMESVCSSTGGDTKKFTIQGYKNAYVGFGMRMKALAEKYNEEKQFGETIGPDGRAKVSYANDYLQKLIVAFKSYVKYDGILDNRYRKHKTSGLQRLGVSDYQTGCVWDGNTPLKKYQDEMKSLIKTVVDAYGVADEETRRRLTVLPFSKEKADDKAIENFCTLFEEVVKSDGGEKLVEIVNKKEDFLFESKKAQTDEQILLSRAKMYDYDSSDSSENSVEGD